MFGSLWVSARRVPNYLAARSSGVDKASKTFGMRGTDATSAMNKRVRLLSSRACARVRKAVHRPYLHQAPEEPM